VFRTKEPTREIKKRFKLPLNEHNVSPVICYNGAVVSESDLLYLNRINALLGPQNEMRLLFVLFKGEPRSVVHDILSAWNGPNMNEFVVFIGLNGQRIAWIDVESWADQTSLHGLVEGEFLDKQFSIPEIGKFVYDNRNHWKRKSFKKDFSYIQPTVQWWSWLILVPLVVAGNAIVCMIGPGVRKAPEKWRY
jgi:hypothetical protein